MDSLHVNPEAKKIEPKQDAFPQIKRDVHESYQYFRRNYERFNHCSRFLFVSTMSDDAKTKLMKLGKPLITCNVLESFLSQRISQFVKQQPAPMVHSNKAPDRKMLLYKMQLKALKEFVPQNEADKQIIPQEIAKLEKKIKTIQKSQEAMIEFISDHARDKISSPQNNQFGRAIYTDTTSGGFAVAELFARYKDDHSFEKEVDFEWEPMPCLCGFDPLARQKHKGDGRYAFKCIPMTVEEFDFTFSEGTDDKSKKVRYAKIPKTNKVKTMAPEDEMIGRIQPVTQSPATFEDFAWGYKNGSQKMVMVVEYYVKEYYNMKLNLLADKSTATDEEYKELKELYRKQRIPLAVPEIVKTRMVQCYTINKYTVYQEGILDVEETDFRILPLVFFDGNSKMIADSANTMYYQECRPYIYHAMGAQQWKDFCMQTAANEVENMVMSKFKMPMEAMPDAKAFQLGYTKPQEAMVLFYQQFLDQDPNVRLDGPQEIQRTPTPPIVMESFYAADRTIQQILGAFDTQPSMDERVSGEAVKQIQMQSESSADPYMQNYILSLNHLLYGYFSLLPLYITTETSFPMRGTDGKRYFKIINHEGEDNPIKLNYNIDDFNITLEAGPSAMVQKQLAIEQLTSIAHNFPKLGSFIQDEAGGVVFDNIEMQGSEALQEKYAEWSEETQEQNAQQQAAAQQLEMRMKEAQVTEVEANALDKKASAMQRLADAQMKVKSHDLAEQKFAAEIFMESERNDREDLLEAAKLTQVRRDSDINALKATADITLQEKKVAAENRRSASDFAVKAMSLHHDVHSAHMDREAAKEEREEAKNADKEAVKDTDNDGE